MSYQISFRGRDEQSIIVDNEKGIKVKELWMSGRSVPFEVNGNAYSTVSIKKIEQVADPKKVDWMDDRILSAEAKKTCRGQYSIQNEINKIAKEEGGAKWAKLISDKKWREQTRMILRQTSDEWCDYRENECYCDSEFLSKKAMFDSSIN